MAYNGSGIYAVPLHQTLKFSINLNRVLHIYLVSKRFIMIENIKQGDTIEFYISCNADRKLFTGKVEYKDQLGLISIVDGVQYELRKLVDIKVLNVC